MNSRSLPPDGEMYRAFAERDAAYDGVFVTAVRTTGIFCRPTCPARKPRRENTLFFATSREALGAGFRPCKRCRPLAPSGEMPEWVARVIDEVEQHPARRWKDADLRAMSVPPERIRRWFQAHHGMTFHQYQRARRLAMALGRLQIGDPVTRSAFDHGFESESGFRDAFKRLFGTPPRRTRLNGSMAVTRIPTPLGPMLAGATPEGVCLLEFTDRRRLETQLRVLHRHFTLPVVPGTNAHLEQAHRELDEYFRGVRRGFEVTLLAPGTAFQTEVWRALGDIPYGETRSYDDVARMLGKLGAQRAVGRANGDNRIAIMIPCHRVVRRDGTLSGYGGGVWRKRRLLDLEREVVAAPAGSVAAGRVAGGVPVGST